MSSEYTSLAQGSIESSPPYMFDRFLSIPWALNMLGLNYTTQWARDIVATSVILLDLHGIDQSCFETEVLSLYDIFFQHLNDVVAIT